jgi:hypothetical protein
MAKYATGKKALAISDRSGLQFPYREMVREWNGSFVHISEFEPKQPQLEPKPMNGDAISLRHVRPDRTEPAVPKLLPVIRLCQGLQLQRHKKEEGVLLLQVP